MKYKYSSKDIQQAVKESRSISSVMRRLGMKVTGGSHSALRARINREKIDTSHFTGAAWNVGGAFKFGPEKIDATLVLSKNRLNGQREKTYRLRRALTEVGVKYECSICNTLPIWNDKPLTLEINHINCDPFDNRKENLQFVCPNCHSQYTEDCARERQCR